jgi:hypothetical protein
VVADVPMTCHIDLTDVVWATPPFDASSMSLVDPCSIEDWMRDVQASAALVLDRPEFVSCLEDESCFA